MNKVYPSTDCDDGKKVGGTVNPMTDDEMLHNSKDNKFDEANTNKINEVLEQVDEEDYGQKSLKKPIGKVKVAGQAAVGTAVIEGMTKPATTYMSSTSGGGVSQNSFPPIAASPDVAGGN